MLKRLYEIVEKSNGKDKTSSIYDYFMMLTIIASIIPLCFSIQVPVLVFIDKITTSIFIIDYFLRFITADINKSERNIFSFIKYPFRPMAIIDLISILPSVTNLNHAFRMLKLFRLAKTFRVFKFFRYSENVKIILNVIRSKKDALITVGFLALAYIFLSALIVFQIEPSTFGSFFKAIYWATVSLTTVGYGDIYPVSDIGRLLSMASSFFGIAVVALPSGIIITGYQEELDQIKNSNVHDPKN